jgi:hypothetical protein
MKALILAIAATLFMAGAANAADTMSSSNNMPANPAAKLSDADCQTAITACKGDANCLQILKDRNACSPSADMTYQQ